MSANTSLFRLQNLDFISLNGPDARSFLQGQVTCDIALLTESNLIRGAICNIKGRVVADFELVATQAGCLMAVSKGLGEQVTTVLAKYAVFSKVEISMEADAYRNYGMIGTEAITELAGVPCTDLKQDYDLATSANDEVWVIRKPGTTPRYEIWSTASETLTSEDSPQQAALWQEEDLRAGIARITPATTAEYTAQDLNYDLSTMVSYSKGCYTGQEIVARMHYRGKAKKRLTLIEVSAATRLAELPDQIVEKASGKRLDNGIIATSRDYLQRQRALVLAILPIGISDSIDMVHVGNTPAAQLSVINLP